MERQIGGPQAGKARFRLARWIALPALFLAALTLPTKPVLAHANLVRSDPPQGASLTAAPAEIVLEFTEQLDPSFTAVQLLDVNAQVVVPGPGTIDANNPTILRLAVGGLPDGIYSAEWKARSVVDGHITNGTVGFSVGVSTARVSLLPPEGAADPATALPNPLDSLDRWAGYLMLALCGGAVAFAVLLWRPFCHRLDPRDPALDARVGHLLQRLCQAGGAGLILTTLAAALLQTAQASGAGFPALLGAPLVVFFGTRSGVLMMVRWVALVGLLILSRRLAHPDEGSSAFWWLAAGLMGVVLMTFSLQSHGAASGKPLLLVADSLHLLAMVIWMGGLLPLTRVLAWFRRAPQAGSRAAASLVPRFSRVALTCVDALAATGVFSAIAQVQTTQALTETTYGRVVILKALLLGLLIGLGAINLLILSPRLSGERPADRWLGRTIRVELVLGGLVLLAAGILTASAPAYAALQAQQRLGYMDSAQSDGVKMVLRVAPASVGDDEFGVDVSDTRPGTEGTPAQVLLRLSMVGRNLGVTQVETASSDGARYTARGSYLTLGGQWQVEVLVRRPGFDDVIHRFDVSISGGAPVAAGTTAESDIPNPIQPDAQSIAAGKALYTQNCVPCHGVSGKGDGPVGITLNPRPADLTYHATPGVHTDGQLFEWITNGYPNSAMPAFKTYLSDTDRWNLVNYIRTLAPSQP